MDYRRNIPFYMGYPQYQNWNQINENMLMEDLDYLQQMYPASSKKYQGLIGDYLDKFDYDESMIYDQYPDRWQLDRITNELINSIKLENDISNDLLPWIKELITILLFLELLKRRKNKRNYRYF